jgi:shikimate kinase
MDGRQISETPTASAQPGPLRRSLVLVGLMGAGKTTVGRRLADRLEASFADSDEEIEAAANMSIAEIFERHGEDYFRDGERRVIARLLEGPACVLATGGGAFMNDETRALINQQAVSIWLKADLDVLVERTAKRTTRPLLRNGDPREILRGLINARYPIYAEAQLTIPSYGGEAHARVVERIMAALGPLDAIA